MTMSNIVVHNHNVSDIERMARAFAVSKLFGVTNPEQAVALCLIAQAEGRHPASAAQDYHIIQGKPSKKADAMLRDFLANGGKVEWHTLDDTTADATFSHPAGGSVRITWDMARAQKAQLKTPMWNKYPRQMLRARVVSEGVRTVFPMATSGMYVPEEVQEFDAPAQSAANVPTDDPRQIEGEVVEPQSKADSRETYERLSKANRALDTVEMFDKFWSQQNVINAFSSLPADWARELVAERDDKAVELQERAAIAQGDGDDFPGDFSLNDHFNSMEAAG